MDILKLAKSVIVQQSAKQQKESIQKYNEKVRFFTDQINAIQVNLKKVKDGWEILQTISGMEELCFTEEDTANFQEVIDLVRETDWSDVEVLKQSEQWKKSTLQIEEVCKMLSNTLLARWTLFQERDRVLFSAIEYMGIENAEQTIAKVNTLLLKTGKYEATHQHYYPTDGVAFTDYLNQKTNIKKLVDELTQQLQKIPEAIRDFRQKVLQGGATITDLEKALEDMSSQEKDRYLIVHK